MDERPSPSGHPSALCSKLRNARGSAGRRLAGRFQGAPRRGADLGVRILPGQRRQQRRGSRFQGWRHAVEGFHRRPPGRPVAVHQRGDQGSRIPVLRIEGQRMRADGDAGGILGRRPSRDHLPPDAHVGHHACGHGHRDARRVIAVLQGELAQAGGTGRGDRRPAGGPVAERPGRGTTGDPRNAQRQPIVADEDHPALLRVARQVVPHDQRGAGGEQGGEPGREEQRGRGTEHPRTCPHDSLLSDPSIVSESVRGRQGGDSSH